MACLLHPEGNTKVGALDLLLEFHLLLTPRCPAYDRIFSCYMLYISFSGIDCSHQFCQGMRRAFLQVFMSSFDQEDKHRGSKNLKDFERDDWCITSTRSPGEWTAVNSDLQLLPTAETRLISTFWRYVINKLQLFSWTDHSCIHQWYLETLQGIIRERTQILGPQHAHTLCTHSIPSLTWNLILVPFYIITNPPKLHGLSSSDLFFSHDAVGWLGGSSIVHEICYGH